jgi:hypothetical protein
MTLQKAQLTWDVLTAPMELTVINDVALGKQHRSWSPISATLIFWEHPRRFAAIRG